VDQQRGFDFGNLFGFGLASVVRNRSVEVRRVDGHLVGHGATPAKTGTPHLTVGKGVRLEIFDGSDIVMNGLR